jgi:hypothetical protein
LESRIYLEALVADTNLLEAVGLIRDPGEEVLAVIGFTVSGSGLRRI